MPDYIYDLQHVGRTEYLQTAKELVDALKGEQCGVYQFGSVSDPGISDLDLIVVYSDGANVTRIAKKCWEFRWSNEIRNYLFTHDILVYPANLFREICYVHSMHNLHYVGGCRYDVISCTSEEIDVVERVLFMEFTHNVYMWIDDILNRRKISLRNVLLCLGSARSSLIIGNRYLEHKKVNELVRNINKVRQLGETPDEGLLSRVRGELYAMLYELGSIWLMEWCDGLKLNPYEDVLIVRGRRFLSLPLPVVILGSILASVGPHGTWVRRVHRLLYPVNFSWKTLDYTFAKVVRKQMELVGEFEKLENNYGIRAMVPLLCNYCGANISLKGLLKLYINWLIVKLQQVKWSS